MPPHNGAEIAQVLQTSQVNDLGSIAASNQRWGFEKWVRRLGHSGGVVAHLTRGA